MKMTDFKKGQRIRFHFVTPSIDDVRIGIIDDIWHKDVGIEIFAHYLHSKDLGFFFTEKDIDRITILTKESHPEEFLWSEFLKTGGNYLDIIIILYYIVAD